MTGRPLVLVSLLLAACGGIPADDPAGRLEETGAFLEGLPPGSLHGEFLSTRTRSIAADGALVRDAARSRIVFVGETHTNPLHHDLQARLVKALFEEDPRVAVGLEMFFRPFQGVLDAYVAGEIDEEEMLRRTEYFSRWSYRWADYAPVLRFARAKGLPVVALNVPREITRVVARGGLEALEPEQRASLPEMDPGNDAHRAFVKKVFLGGHELPADRFESFYAAMTIWDETMAESAVRFLRSPEGRDRRLVVLVGSGHVRHRFGIPDRVARRADWPLLVIVPEEYPASGPAPDWRALLASDAGDYVFLTPPPPAWTPPRLGVEVETENPPERGILVRKATEDDPAARGGVRAGDVLIRLGRRNLSDIVDLRLALEEIPRGRDVPLTLVRDGVPVETAVRIPEPIVEDRP